MRVLVTGSTGLIGSALVPVLRQAGHTVARLVRTEPWPGPGEVGRDPRAGRIDAVCRDWEAAADPARAAGIRVVHLRTGIVLSRAGGALPQMLTPFRLGLGGRIGSGAQYMSWVTLTDVVGIFQHVLADGALQGPVNAVSPQPVTNLEFTRTLARALSRPALLPLPDLVARLLLGEMADALLLSSARVEPSRLLASGYSFHEPRLQPALRSVLRK